MANFEVSLSVSEGGRRRPEYSLNTDLNGEISFLDLLNWTKQALIVTADEVLKEEQARGFDKEPVMLVDGRRNRNPHQVSPLGSFEFIARMDMADILLETYDALLSRSKVLTGLYKSSHFVFHNGAQVATDAASLQTWVNSGVAFKDKDTIRIVNIQPYARKLERYGVTAQRSKTKYDSKDRRKGKSGGKQFLVPNGTYALTARAIKAKYKQNAIISFKFLPGSSMGLTGSFKRGRPGKNSAGRTYLYPSIVFTVSERGIV